MIRLFSATLLSLLLCASLANAAEKPLIVASDATWPPIEMLDENKNVVGYSIDYLKAVAKEAGLRHEQRRVVGDLVAHGGHAGFLPGELAQGLPAR